MFNNTLTQNPLANAVPPHIEQAGFTMQYKRYSWGASVHVVHTKSGEVRAYVSDYTLGKSRTLQELSRKSTRIKNDMSPWVSRVRLQQWANDNSMYFRTWKQASDNTVEVIA